MPNGAGEECVAVRTGDALDALLLAQFVQLPLRAAFGVANIDAFETFCPCFGYFFTQCRDDFFRVDVPDRRKTLQVDVIQAIGRFHSEDFAGNGAASDDAKWLG